MIGRVKQEFEHHATIELPNGRRFQIAASDIERLASGTRIRAGAYVEHIFPGAGEQEAPPGNPIEVPKDILDQLS